MAVIKTGPHIANIRGRQGTKVYSEWKGKSYLRSCAKSISNPRSAAQSKARARLGGSSQYWHKSLTDAQRALWSQYAVKQAGCELKRKEQILIIPYKGYTVSGYNAFVMVNGLLFAAGLLAQGVFASFPPTSTELFNPPTALDAVWNYGRVVYFSEDFEDEAVNATPDLWTPAWAYFSPGTSYIKVVNTPVHAGSRACEIVQQVGLTQSFYQVTQLTTNDTELHLYTRAAQNNTNTPIVYTTPVPLPVASGLMLAFWGDGNVRYSNGAVWTIAQPYVVGSWYHAKAVIHDAARTWDLYIDDMVNPVAVGINYRAPNSCSYIQLITNAGACYVDDIWVGLTVPLGISYTWTDPVGMHANTRIRVWIYSEETGVHKQQVATIALGEEAHALTYVRVAKGRTVPIASLPGNYWVQLDAVGPSGVRTAPSNAALINVP